MSEYVYMVREKEFIDSGENIYKIGGVTLDPNAELADFLKGSELMASIKVNNRTYFETKIKEVFSLSFVQKIEYGTEYFCGDPDEMLKEFLEYVSALVSDQKFEKGKGCEHCGYTTVEYLTDGVYGPCFECSDWDHYDEPEAKRLTKFNAH